MNVLEKILEKIEKESESAHEEMRRCARENPMQFDEVKGYARSCEVILDIIRSHMNDAKDLNVPTQKDWIPVDERLPGNKASVLICYDNGEIDIGWHDGRNWRTGYSHADIRENVIAWKPAPDPYRPAEE